MTDKEFDQIIADYVIADSRKSITRGGLYGCVKEMSQYHRASAMNISARQFADDLFIYLERGYLLKEHTTVSPSDVNYIKHHCDKNPLYYVTVGTLYWNYRDFDHCRMNGKLSNITLFIRTLTKCGFTVDDDNMIKGIIPTHGSLEFFLEDNPYDGSLDEFIERYECWPDCADKYNRQTIRARLSDLGYN